MAMRRSDTSGRCRRGRAVRWLAYLVLAAPLLQTSCVDIATRSVINGFFNGLNAVLRSELSGGAGP